MPPNSSATASFACRDWYQPRAAKRLCPPPEWAVLVSAVARDQNVSATHTTQLDCATPPGLRVLRQAQHGDEEAFSLIVAEYQLPVFNYVFRLVGDRELAEDLTQDVFLRVFHALPQFALRSTFKTWLFQVAKNRVLDEFRARERRPHTVIDIEEAPPVPALDPSLERSELLDAVWRAIENLSADLKMPLLLRDVVGLSYTEIAEALEVALPTVRWRIYQAREDVQRALAHQGIHRGSGRPNRRHAVQA
jgi:RNA polymerase sigma-70 factor, ECF subfamily